MISYNLNHSHEIDKTFSDYLITIPRFVNNYNSLLDALKHLNKNQEKKPIVFIKSNCSEKVYACLYCSDKDYDSSIRDIENIIVKEKMDLDFSHFCCNKKGIVYKISNPSNQNLQCHE